MWEKLFALLLILLLPSVYGIDDLTLRESAVLDLNIHSSIDADFTSSGASIEDVKVSLMYLIQNTDNQKLLMLKTMPDAKISDRVIYEWTNPHVFPLNYSLKASVETNSYIKKVTKKVDFPIKEFPKEIYEYTKPTSMIDVNDDIKQLAFKLSENEDDLYSVVFNLADWTNQNIKYDLSSAGANAVEKSSWVLKNRVGVCDELTNLFISMCRSLGIPARFVTGMSYTNDPQFQKPWGLHGWAEVYFPEYGWVPFDTTYGEFGYIDAGHIKLKDTLDSNKSSTEYEWKGKNIELLPGPLETEVNILSKGNLALPSVDLSIQVFDDNVGFNSYDYVETIVTNRNNYYVASEVSLSLPSEIGVEGEKNRPILLRPYEKKSIFWIIQVPKDLREDYRYTFPLAVTLPLQNYSITSEFESAKKENVIDYDTIKKIIDKKESVNERDDGITFFCDPDKKEIGIGESAVIKCVVENNLSARVEDLNVCLINNCKNINVESKGEKELSFEKSFDITGYKLLEITAKNSVISKTAFVNIMVLDLPSIEITELKYPEKVNFDDSFAVTFIMTKKSYAEPKNTKVIIYHNKNKESWNIDKMDGIVPFSIDLSGGYMKFGENKMKVIVSYEDDKGNIYNSEKDFIINLGDTTFMQKIQVIINQISLWFDRMMNK